MRGMWEKECEEEQGGSGWRKCHNAVSTRPGPDSRPEPSPHLSIQQNTNCSAMQGSLSFISDESRETGFSSVALSPHSCSTHGGRVWWNTNVKKKDGAEKFAHIECGSAEIFCLPPLSLPPSPIAFFWYWDAYCNTIQAKKESGESRAMRGPQGPHAYSNLRSFLSIHLSLISFMCSVFNHTLSQCTPLYYSCRPSNGSMVV